MKIAHICTPHGFGHITRQVALAQALKNFGVQSTFFCHQPHIVHNTLPEVPVYTKSADVGLVQPSTTQIDIQTTLQLLAKRCTEETIERWAEELLSFDLILADTPPLIFEASRRAHVPVLGIGNFDWAWIYQHYPRLEYWQKLFVKWQKNHHAIRLLPGPPLSSFHTLQEFHCIARPSSPYPLPKTSILISFGGITAHSLQSIPKIPNVCWVIAPPTPKIIREDILYIENVPYPNLIAGADIVFSKAGYGILNECLHTGTPQLWLHRPGFPETPYLESYAKERGDHIITAPLGSQTCTEELKRMIPILQKQKRERVPLRTEELAQWIIKNYGSCDVEDDVVFEVVEEDIVDEE